MPSGSVSEHDHREQRSNRRRSLTIFFISLRTSSSFIGRDMVGVSAGWSVCVMLCWGICCGDYGEVGGVVGGGGISSGSDGWRCQKGARPATWARARCDCPQGPRACAAAAWRSWGAVPAQRDYVAAHAPFRRNGRRRRQECHAWLLSIGPAQAHLPTSRQGSPWDQKYSEEGISGSYTVALWATHRKTTYVSGVGGTLRVGSEEKKRDLRGARKHRVTTSRPSQGTQSMWKA